MSKLTPIIPPLVPVVDEFGNLLGFMPSPDETQLVTPGEVPVLRVELPTVD